MGGRALPWILVFLEAALAADLILALESYALQGGREGGQFMHDLSGFVSYLPLHPGLIRV